MTKEQFIQTVSKISQTSEDEFKAEFNSPELLWTFISKSFVEKTTTEKSDLTIFYEKDFKTACEFYESASDALKSIENSILAKLIDENNNKQAERLKMAKRLSKKIGIGWLPCLKMLDKYNYNFDKLLYYLTDDVKCDETFAEMNKKIKLLIN